VRGTLKAKRSDAEVVGMQVAQRWLDCHGQQARAWLDQVTSIARSWAQRWNFTLDKPLEGGSVSVVYLVKCEDGSAVLKLAAPWSRWSREEAAALRAWDGHGAVRLLAASDDASALLLERVCPGTPAIGMTAAEFADLLAKLSRPPVPPEMPSLADAVQLRFDRAQENRHGLLSAAQIKRARCAGVELAARVQPPSVLCHGDLLSKNILQSHDRGVLVIDPNPCAGHPAYDAAQWAVTETPVAQAPQRATTIAATLGIPAEDVLQWVCVLAAAEVCLASLDRAKASLELTRRFSAEWVRDYGS
jgi:streptomycin 6-kinase